MCAQVNEYKYDMERLTRELQDTKRRYYEQKRRETLARERERQGDRERYTEQLTVTSMG